MRIADLKERERAARDHERNIAVIAGAGTGKTSLLIERILHLVLERGAPLDRIAAITFTEKAAAEMRDRLEEALEAAAAILSGRGGAVGGGEEARRVFERLEGAGAGKGGRGKLLERTLTAIEQLDRSAIDTIHGFAAEILRRNPVEAGVDPEFRADDGTEADRLFDELWSAYLLEVLGDPESGAAEAWRQLLGRLPIDGVEAVARELCGFRIPPEVLGPDCAAAQSAHLRAFAREAAREARSLLETVDRVSGVNQNFLRNIAIVEEVFGGVAGGGPIPTEVELEGKKLGTSISVGSRAEIADKNALKKRLEKLLKTCRDLGRIDPELVPCLREALGLLLERFRGEFLRRGWISFDAMIILARDLLRDHPDVRRREGERLDHLLIDEFQDTDPLQYEIAFFLAERRGNPARDAYAARLEAGKLFIVGDPKQSIYRFRGADIEAYLRAVGRLREEGGAVIGLRTNFRSVPEAIEPLNELFAARFAGGGPCDPEFEPIAAARDGAGAPAIEVWSVGRSELRARERREAEAEAVAAGIEELRSGGAAFKDIAILFRALSEVDIYLRALRRRGIPYLVEGGMGFYSRFEVEHLLALLRAATNPADSVSLIACLRSPAAAVPDRELQEWAAAGEGGARWSMEARPDARTFPRLAAALEMLHAFRDRHRGEPIDRLARAALEETPLRLAMAASYEGAQRVANLEKAVKRIAELAWDGRLSPAEVLDHIEEREARARDEADSPLADETVDAVRVLSIHRAKGLEWPVVIIPDLARGRGDSRRGSVVVKAARGAGAALPAALALRAGDRVTPAWPGHLAEGAHQEEAEARRLFYVAATRAADRLILVAGPPKNIELTWIIYLSTWGYRLDGGVPEGESLAGGAVLHRVFLEPLRARGPGAAVPAGDALLEAVRAFEEARKGALAAERDWLRRPSDPERRSEEDMEEGGTGGRAGRPRPEEPPGEPAAAIARAAGTAVHLLLELWDRRDPGWLIENAARAARTAAAGESAPAAEVEAAARAVIERARADGRLAAVAAAGDLGREVPLLYRGEDGAVWEGTIDLVGGTLADPEVIDFKTAAGLDTDELERRYRPQLERYAAGLGRALALGRPARARLEPLGAGWEETRSAAKPRRPDAR